MFLQFELEKLKIFKIFMQLPTAALQKIDTHKAFLVEHMRAMVQKVEDACSGADAALTKDTAEVSPV